MKSLSRTFFLNKAGSLITGDRQKAYGDAEINFGRTAKLWQTYLEGRDLEKDPLKPHDVAILNQLQKISRIANDYKKVDNWIDLVGFSALGGELACKVRKYVRKNVFKMQSENEPNG